MAYLRGLNTIKHLNKSSRHVLEPNPILYSSQGVRYRTVEIILTSDVEKLGKCGNVVKVAPGYFRNHLMPKLLAVPNIDKFAHLIKNQRKIYRNEEDTELIEDVHDEEADTLVDAMKEYKSAAHRLDQLTLSIRCGVNAEKFKARASKEDPIEVNTPITKDLIVKEVARQMKVEIDEANVHLPNPLTKFGVYEVPLKLPRAIPLPEGKHHWVLKVKIRGKFLVENIEKQLYNVE